MEAPVLMFRARCDAPFGMGCPPDGPYTSRLDGDVFLQCFRRGVLAAPEGGSPDDENGGLPVVQLAQTALELGEGGAVAFMHGGAFTAFRDLDEQMGEAQARCAGHGVFVGFDDGLEFCGAELGLQGGHGTEQRVDGPREREFCTGGIRAEMLLEPQLLVFYWAFAIELSLCLAVE